ncbi:MAG: pyruvate, phosphate dikinase [Candidatus Thermoplasmatota archaeon]|nr:pyruvate, phosphate dikinase [Candidatus Thermoplasmatota archaeon]
MSSYVYSFEEGSADMKDLLGGKGSNLAEMTTIGLKVPPGFTVTTEACLEYLEEERLPEEIKEEMKGYMEELEETMDQNFGDPEDPLLVSVRSGAAVSMPGMMDTILNLGLNDETLQGLIEKTDERFAYDSYRRFVNMFGEVVRGIPHREFEEIMDEVKEKRNADQDVDLDAEGMKEVTERYKELVGNIPSDPWEQLVEATKAVFGSWDNERAIRYRNLNDLPQDMGTAVNVQAMVYGNTGEKSGSGVAFTRNPSTGKNEIYGEFLQNAQGEDVVAGIRTPLDISDLKEMWPDIYKELEEVCSILEEEYKDMQDLEFTVEEKELYILQTRTGKRTPNAAVKIAHDMHEEGIISKKVALLRVEGEQVEKILHKRIDPDAELDKLTQGLNASPGAASGKVVFDTDEAERRGNEGENVILVRPETTPEDIHGLAAADGVLTTRGGMTSHAAVVARGMGKPCVAGAEEIDIDLDGERFRVDGREIEKEDMITIDGTTGDVIWGEAPLIEPEFTDEFEKLLGWADDIRNMGVWTNADTPEDAQKALDFGAEGIGLCRTEHMFFDPERLEAVHEMIIAEDEEKRKEALDELLPMQKEDFKGLFRVMDGLTLTVRLLDPPLHEFAPTDREAQENLAERMDIDVETIRNRVARMDEANPMLGHRGCRLGITYPEIYRMQVRAILEAASEVQEEGTDVEPHIMVPLVGNVSELKNVKEKVIEPAEEQVFKEKEEVDYQVGTMIEIPRASLTADEIAEEADFFSFGTNDLTQMGLGFSRDDVGTFVPNYLDEGIIDKDPFQVLDQDGIGELVEIGTKRGRETQEDLSVGICGEHGGEPSSVKFCYRSDLDYVSCSPYRVPVARVAAAQVVIEDEMKVDEGVEGY